MDADVVIDADETPCAVLQASRTVDMHPSPRIAGRGCQRRIRGDGARAREWRECRQRREQEVVRLHASRSPLIRLSATFSPPSGEKESRYASRTVDMHPSPRIAGRGCQRRVRGDGARAREWRGCRQRREQEVGAAACIALAPHPAPYQVRGRLFGHLLPAARGEGVRYASLTRVVAKRVPRQRSSTGTHLQPSWTKLGLRTTVPMWSPWLFTWIRRAAAAAPTTRAVSRGHRKDRVNASVRCKANCAPGHRPT